MKVGLILLAGGTGTRMGLSIPKQYYSLSGRPVALHSLEVFRQVPAIAQIVIVADSEYHHLFPGHTFASPGARRQDSVWNGLQKIDPSIDYICVHDAARPFITVELVESVVKEACKVGAAAAAVPLKFSVKQADSSGKVQCTLDRSTIWEMQTPQVVRKDLLQKGFALAIAQNLTATDDVGLVELFDQPVQLVPGSYQNLKLTTREDIQIAELYANGL